MNRRECRTDHHPEIAVTLASAAWTRDLPRARAIVRGAAMAALAGAQRIAPGTEVSIVLADDRLSARLNRQYRRRRGATNVLSFPAGNRPDTARADGRPHLLGDVVIAYGVCRTEAARAGRATADHLRHLVVHGVLHLVGYDHQTMAQALRMERLEVSVLAGLGIADPYARPQAGRRRAR